MRTHTSGEIDRERLTLIGHELMHAVQYDRVGQSDPLENLFAFGYQYFQELFRAGGNYQNNSMEIEAYQQQDLVGAAYDKAVKVQNDTTGTVTLQISYEVPDPNALPGFYLTTPMLTFDSLVTVQGGQTAIVMFRQGPYASLLPVDEVLSLGGRLQVQITSDPTNIEYLQSYPLDPANNLIVLQPVFDGI